jgi:hypothetical protein
MATVSVIVPCYQYAHYLPGCIASVLGQEGVEVRALIIDDASPDNTAAVATVLAQQDRRLEFRRHAVNQGHIATYNEGLKWAEGDYLLLISADDLLVPGALDRASRLLGAHPEVGLTWGRQIQFRGTTPPTPTPPDNADSWRIVRGLDFIASCCAVGHNPVATPTVVVRIALQKALGGYRTDLPHTADLEMWLRFAARADVGVIDADQAWKRMHEQNMQRQFLATVLGDLKQRHAAFRAFFGEHGAPLPNASQLLGRAEHALAESAFWMASHAFDRGDTAACQELLGYARTLDPDLPAGQAWARLQRKRRLGPRVWSVLRPLVERLRGSEVPCPGLREGSA